jgi:hypothetical protein
LSETRLDAVLAVGPGRAKVDLSPSGLLKATDSVRLDFELSRKVLGKGPFGLRWELQAKGSL